MPNDDGTISVIPVNVRLDLTNGLDINQAIQACVNGQKLTGFTINLLPATVNVTRAYGSGSPTRCFQGQSFNFGSYGDCVGVMDQGLHFGCAAAPGMFLEVELYFAPNIARVVSSQ